MVKDVIQFLALKQVVTTLRKKEDINIGESQAQFRGFYSAYFIGPKKDGGYSNIVDVSGLNKFLKILPFRMLHVADALQAIACGD